MALSDADRFVLIVGKIKQPPIVKHEKSGASSSVSVAVPLFSLGTGSGCVLQADLKLMIPLPSLLEITEPCHHFQFGWPLLENSLLLSIMRIC